MMEMERATLPILDLTTITSSEIAQTYKGELNEVNIDTLIDCSLPVFVDDRFRRLLEKRRYLGGYHSTENGYKVWSIKHGWCSQAFYGNSCRCQRY